MSKSKEEPKGVSMEEDSLWVMLGVEIDVEWENLEYVRAALSELTPHAHIRIVSLAGNCKADR